MYSQSQMQILALLFSHPGEEYYLSQIGEAIGKKPGHFQRGIQRLERDGVLRTWKRGNQRVFVVNQDYPLLQELRSIVNKTVGVEAILRVFVGELSGIEAAAIYGSYAQDTLRPDSDIDVLLIASNPSIEDTIVDGLSAVEERIRREVNYILYTRDEFDARRKARDPFVQEILTNRIIVLKGELKWISDQAPRRPARR